MQKLTTFNPNETLDKAIPKLSDDILTVLSSSSGNAFPTDGLQVGMVCYRTDLGKAYVLTSLENNNPVWTILFSINFAPGVAEFDSDGNEIAKHYLSVDGGTMNGPIKYGTAPSNENELANKAYVDATMQAASKDVSKKLSDSSQALSNSISELKTDIQTNGVSKLTTPRNINNHPFDGTGPITITPSDISVNAGDGSNASSANPATSFVRTKHENTLGGRAYSNAVFYPSSWTVTVNSLSTSPAFPGGTYTLAQVLETLINNCHSHKLVSTSGTVNVDCYQNCNCNCCDSTC